MPYRVAQLADAIAAALLLQAMLGNVSARGTYPIAKPGGDWRSAGDGDRPDRNSGEHHPQYGRRSIGHNVAISVGPTVVQLGLFASPINGASMNPARSIGPDIAGADHVGWWVLAVGPVSGAAIAVIIIRLVRGLPDKQARDAAQGGAMPW